MSWNVNSITVRLARLLDLLKRESPDVLCLQELKCVDEKFPHDAIKEAGYHAECFGQKTYNGVAILTKAPMSCVTRSFGDAEDDPQARFIAAMVQGVHVMCVYIPNGSEMGSDKCAYKIKWYARLRAWLDKHIDADAPAIVCGDFNVALTDADAAHPEKWTDTVMAHKDMRDALGRITSFGLTDVFAKHHPAGGLYSWWDYRHLGFQKNNGLRIDLLMATQSLACRSTAAAIDKDERRGERPSDHAPVSATFAWP